MSESSLLTRFNCRLRRSRGSFDFQSRSRFARLQPEEHF